MDKFTRLRGTAAVLQRPNIDTDELIPQQYLTTVQRTGLGKGLLHALRYDAHGREKPEFVLNREPYRHACILIAGENFGCGSSREHAAWALLDFGIRCMIAPSFAAIFRNNCFKNGILPIELPPGDIDAMVAAMHTTGVPELAVDLLRQQIELPDGRPIPFQIEEARRTRLLGGLDEIELTLQQSESIDRYAQQSRQAYPWLWERGT